MKKYFVSFLLSIFSIALWATDNRVETVSVVNEQVTLSDAVDYHITGTEPFGVSGIVNIVNKEKAVLVFDNVSPSEVNTMLSHIKIGGAVATATNSQVRIHGHGTIVYPYSKDICPLTVYTEDNYKGQSMSSYAVGEAVNLTSATLNNSICAFTLKRGYMVCFGTSTNGKGYSRVFVADDSDVSFSTIPAELYGKVSTLRISKWNSTDKRGYAGNDVKANDLLKTTWCYNWDAGVNVWDDREYVTQHHHEGWPAVADVGNNGTSANIIGNNEPDNTSDSREQVNTVDEVLANWPAMMATGKRLGSPAVSGNYSWLYQFIDSIDARGWRCDFICVHAYWYNDVSSWKSTLQSIYNRTHRPIWITEMNYGANWTGWPGSDTSGSDANYAIEKQHFAPVMDYLNESPIIERYAVYNWVQDCRKMYYTNDDDSLVLTPMGSYYANSETSRGYNAAYEYVPVSPRTYAASNLETSFTPRTSICKISWHDDNGEFNDSMFVERRNGLKGEWERVAVIDVKESSSDYSYMDSISSAGSYYYRIHDVLYDYSDIYSGEVENIVNGTMGTDEFQYGTVSTMSTEDSYNFFSTPFSSMPAIVFGSPTSADTNIKPVEHVVNSYKIGTEYSYFRFNYFPWSLSGYQTFTNGAEFSSYIVSKCGNGKIGTLNYESGYIHNSDGSDMTVGNDSIEVLFDKPFDDVPVVFATPRYSTSLYPYMWRVWDVTKNGFKLVLQRQKGLDSTIPGFVKQRVAYFAIDKGTTTIDGGKEINVGEKDLNFTNLGSAVKMEYGVTLTNPMLLCQLQSYNRKVAGFLRTGRTGPNTTYSMVRFVPDSTDFDNNEISRSNPVMESIGWISISDSDAATSINDIEGYNGSSDAGLRVFVSGGVVTLEDDKASRVDIYTVEGKKVASVKLINGYAEIKMCNQVSGMYIASSDSGNKVKFIK